MNTAAEVLVIIVSSILSLFLIVAIIALVMFIKILKHIRRIVEKAELIAGKAESVSEFFQKTAGPAAIVKLVSNIIHSVKSNKTARRKNER